MTAATAGAKPRHSFDAYLKPKTLVMLALGFSSGLPFLLVGNTFSYWLRDEGTTLTAIGFISWVGLAYSFKFIWSPIVDRVPVPFLGKLGRRRGWMLLAQILVAFGLIAMALTDPKQSLAWLGIFALVTAFASATQDIAIDAWRIESAANQDEQGLLISAATLGYRSAMLASEALILLLATRLGWGTSYFIYGLLMSVGVVACLFAKEPAKGDQAIAEREANAPLTTGRGLYDAVVGPFVIFFRTHGPMSLLMLLAISLFQLPNFVMGPMANPLYHDIGLTKDVVGAVRGTFGLVAVFAGVATGGYLTVRLGYMRALYIGGALQILGTMAYAILPFVHDRATFAAVMAFDNFSIAVAGVTLVAYMSTLTNAGYTATQYAFLSSNYTWPGKLLKGFSGIAVQSLAAGHGLINAYAIFFVGAGLIGVPAILLFALLNTRQKAAAAAAGS